MANLDNVEPFLSLVVKKGNLDTVKSLIEKGADINCTVPEYDGMIYEKYHQREELWVHQNDRGSA